MNVHRMDHVGINVQDLDAAVAFFQELGLEVQGRMDVEGEWAEQVGRIIGLKGVKDTIAMLGIPGGPAAVELVKFHSPVDKKGLQPSSSNTLGMRHLCFNVDDVDALVAALTEKHGAELMGEVLTYENMYKLCYLRGPEGIIVELAEKIG
jgi:catechol 2,3-dioxygenase-like lactoylglutathione lyase family enzyme